MSCFVIPGDCIELMASMDAKSVDAIVTDPPYGLTFMGRDWDSLGHGSAQQAWHFRWLTEALRVLKPGGHILAFGGTRTYHRMVCAAEDAGFEIRDSIHYMHGSGFPKSHNVSLAFDKIARGAPQGGADPQKRGTGVVPDRAALGRGGATGKSSSGITGKTEPYEPITDEAKQWDGWGTALKPAHEPIVLARKPLIGTVAANVRAHGVGGLNIDGCRVGSTDGGRYREGEATQNTRYTKKGCTNFAALPGPRGGSADGRWPPNILLTHAAACKPVGAQKVKGSGIMTGNQRGWGKNGIYGTGGDTPATCYTNPDGTETVEAWACAAGCPVATLDGQSGQGGVSRFFPALNWDPVYDVPFFYCAKAAKKEKEAGCEALAAEHKRKRGNNHPTVKPVALMRYLIRLITPPGGFILDPFGGSGTTGVAALQEGNNTCILMEQDPASVEVANARLAHTRNRLKENDE
jgi:predicted RNA methylase